MKAQILHSGFDGLRFTVQAEIGPELRAELALAKAHAKEHRHDIERRFGEVLLSVTQAGATVTCHFPFAHAVEPKHRPREISATDLCPRPSMF
ncbi:hypothetical protein OE699_02485 [Sedimentimonas flavescens]|uniref:Uncharacterized protein n=1 Tax=Sedimentimonas flavescens TaxID=2851012 RepID=A0ABT2ZVP0_9RHOB|nr:hypothetical protein [Sedimentimonas flavescens]MCV2877708.1 hypothetical protein [Sedimentimonas flavescens]